MRSDRKREESAYLRVKSKETREIRRTYGHAGCCAHSSTISTCPSTQPSAIAATILPSEISSATTLNGAPMQYVCAMFEVKVKSTSTKTSQKTVTPSTVDVNCFGEGEGKGV